jgi:hypothetical protein
MMGWYDGCEMELEDLQRGGVRRRKALNGMK